MYEITIKELYVILKLGLIFALRMSGVFMILPVLTIYATSLQAANEHLIGIAIGIYGCTQILFLLPFGFISDKIGHKYVIIAGLIIFTIGSEIAALTNNIWGLIIGRALQGSGAISSSLIALLLDSVQDKNKTKAMAIIGVSFGITFAISIILGPIITDKFGFHGLFQIITLLAILAIIVTYTITPNSLTKNHIHQNNTNFLVTFNNIRDILSNIQLIKLNISIFCLHTILMLNFIILPQSMIALGYTPDVHGKIYSIIILISACIVLPYTFYTKKKHRVHQILIFCTNILFLSELIMLVNIHHRWIFLCGIQLFFISFNLIEMILPYLISQKSPQKYRSTTISIYSIGQFLGTGFGGIIGGFLLEMQGTWMVLLFALVISSISIIVSNKLS